MPSWWVRATTGVTGALCVYKVLCSLILSPHCHCPCCAFCLEDTSPFISGRLLFRFPGGSVGKNLPDNAGGAGLIPGLGSSPGEGNGNPLQYSCLGNPMDRGAWWGYSLWGHKRGRHDVVTKQKQQTLVNPVIPRSDILSEAFGCPSILPLW